MMRVVKYPERKDWVRLVQRPVADNAKVKETVIKILAAVKKKGDLALRKYNKSFDDISISELKVSESEIRQGAAMVSPALQSAICQAASNILSFHKREMEPPAITTMPGILCWRKMLPIDTVGLYIPGGTAPLFSSLLMLGIPANEAGCRKIIVCTPPGKDGKIHPAILYTASLLGITEIYKIGGAQAIAALAYGTESVPRVNKIFGPGNQYVTAAKQMVQSKGVAIDMPAGPSEIFVIASEGADPSFIAADLLSQAEHGKDSQVLLISDNEGLVNLVMMELERQLASLSRKEIASTSLGNSLAVILKDMDQAIAMANEYAPEHLLLIGDAAEALADKVTNAGSVFLGAFSPEAAGDYASGTNHTLPTNGYAKSYSGVNTSAFMKTITYQKLTSAGLKSIAETIMTMAEGEGLEAHSNAIKIRLNK